MGGQTSVDRTRLLARTFGREQQPPTLKLRVYFKVTSTAQVEVVPHIKGLPMASLFLCAKPLRYKVGIKTLFKDMVNVACSDAYRAVRSTVVNFHFPIFAYHRTTYIADIDHIANTFVLRFW